MSWLSIALLSTLKCIVWTYDIITLPAYFLFQQPWKKWKYHRYNWGKPLREDDPYSPCVRIIRSINNDIPRFRNLQTIDEYFRKSVECYGPRDCTGVRELLYEADEYHKDGKILKKVYLGDYKWLTFNEMDARIENLSKGMLEIGIQPKQQVMIFAETRLEWMLVAQACFRLNVPVVTLYATLGEDGIIHGINETEVTHIFTSQDILHKLQKIISEIPNITHIVYMENVRQLDNLSFSKNFEVLSISKLEEIGTCSKVSKPDPPIPDDLALIMYTSGSTGIPKGVKLTHKNMIATLSAYLTDLPKFYHSDVFIGYLPLAHAIEILAECLYFTLGIRFGYASPMTLTSKSPGIASGCEGDIQVLKPTVLITVPLILDRIKIGINEGVKQKSHFAQKLFLYAMSYKRFWFEKGFQTPILRRLIFKKIQDAVGGRLRFVILGGAPLSPDTQMFAKICLDVQIMQAYGLTETAANGACMDINEVTSGRIGPPSSNSTLKLVDWPEGNYFPTDKPNPRGELAICNDSVSPGYFKREELTEESFKTENGKRWFYTGDVMELYPDGSLKMIDRKKDIIKLQHGEYISLGKVESELKSCPFVENICVVGNGFHTYVIALICPNVIQMNILAKSLKKEGLEFCDTCQDPDIISEVLKKITEQGHKSKLLRLEIPTKIKLCSEEWTPDSGLVTAAFKIRRKQIEQYYKDSVAELYNLNIKDKHKRLLN